MALTATATAHVREDILKSLRLSREAKVVLTTFFRPNLQFSVIHSRTSSSSSYAKDFQELVNVYTSKRTSKEKSHNISSVMEDPQDSEGFSSTTTDSTDVDDLDELDDDSTLLNRNGSNVSKERQLSVEFLEEDYDEIQTADDYGVSCGEFCGKPIAGPRQLIESTELQNSSQHTAQRLEPMIDSLGHGPTIMYVPTRKETLTIAKYLCSKGVKAASYNAALPKSHLRRVLKEFHENAVDVVVATIAFGMGIDKHNVRRIIHYGWPQSLEAYYQEAGRAGRDGKLADCILYANLTRLPTLLPNKRSEEQKKQAYKMLTDCFKYGMNTSICRAKILVEYFGEAFNQEKCNFCDICRNGPPEIQNMKAEANIFMQVLTAHYKQLSFSFAECSYDESLSKKPNLRIIVTKIREHSQQFLATDQLWWRGLSRLLQDKGYIGEGGEMIGVQIKYPEPTNSGLRFLEPGIERDFFAYPEADMLLSANRAETSFASFSEWGKGWADPEIRKQRLARMKSSRKSRKSRKPMKKKFRRQSGQMTVKERITARLSKWKS